MPFTSTAILVTPTRKPRGSGYNQMRREFRELFDSKVRGEKSAVRVVRACIEDDQASWGDRLKAVEFAAKYGFGLPEKLDEEQIVIFAERKLEKLIAEARAELGPIDVTPASGGDAE
jgi:hypothetical protein